MMSPENQGVFQLLKEFFDVVTNPPSSNSKDGRAGFFVPSIGKRTKTNGST
jgi:hypothetical protein